MAEGDPKKLYVYLKGGRGDAYVSSIWDGAEPTEEGALDENNEPEDAKGLEVADPYRDIHDGSATMVYSAAGASSGQVPVASALVLQDDETIDVTAPTGGVSPAGVNVVPQGDIKASTSDEKAHVKPRQYTKVFTWLVFKDTDEATYKFRKAEVLGWGSNPRT
jgi:hypothetical protein